jgi:hypothetical protein
MMIFLYILCTCVCLSLQPLHSNGWNPLPLSSFRLSRLQLFDGHFFFSSSSSPPPSHCYRNNQIFVVVCVSLLNILSRLFKKTHTTMGGCYGQSGKKKKHSSFSLLNRMQMINKWICLKTEMLIISCFTPTHQPTIWNHVRKVE